MMNRPPDMSPGREQSGMNLSKRAAPTGAAFTADLSAVGGVGAGGAENIFGADKTNILDEERRLIDKVFSIVDKDNSGSIDAKELEEMFQLFGVETHFLKAAIERVMANVDQDKDGQISPGEFHKLLSQKFMKGDSEKEMEDVFDRMGGKPAAASNNPNSQDFTKVIGIDELHKVALMLGETSMAKVEVKDMIRCFKRLAAKAALVPVVQSPDDAKKRAKPPKLRTEEHYAETDEKDPQNLMDLKEFIAIMNMDL